MNDKFFQIVDDVSLSNRWFLQAPRDRYGKDVDPESFRVARSVEVAEPLAISVREHGDPLDWTFADFDMPVVSGALSLTLRRVAAHDIKIHSASVEGYDNEYAVINVLTRLKCVSETNSEFLKWNRFDNRPDKIGQYRQMSRLRIDPSNVGTANIFRVEGWSIALIISRKVKEAFEDMGVSGVHYIGVG